MASQLLASSVVGMSFGSALLLAGVAGPATMIGQFELTNFHMLVTFLAATSLSSIIVYVSNRTGYARLAPRSCAEYGLPVSWLKGRRYVGNVVGGIFQGVAMAISGACPGTVLVQTVLGWGTGAWALFGHVLGGLMFVGMQEYLRVRSVNVAEVKTFQEKLGVTTELMVVVFECVITAVIVLISSLAPLGTYWRNAVVGGGFIGIVQAGSVLISKKTLGVSTAYQDVAGHLWALVDGKRARPGWSSIVFALGVMAGAYACRDYVLQPMPLMLREHDMVEISLPAAIIGGALSAFGARLAGGCTSGHGISGFSTLSISSLITVVSISVGGVAFRALSS